MSGISLRVTDSVTNTDADAIRTTSLVTDRDDAKRVITPDDNHCGGSTAKRVIIHENQP